MGTQANDLVQRRVVSESRKAKKEIYMDPATAYVLARNVTVIPVAQLNEADRIRVGGEEGDCLISRAGGRAASTVISGEAAALLEQFRTPREIAEGVLLHGLTHSVDPQCTLRQAIPLLHELFRDRLLVSEDEASIEALFLHQAGEKVGPAEVVRPVAMQEDSQIFQCRMPGGEYAALKCLNSRDVQLAGDLGREETILQFLNGPHTPKLLASDVVSEKPYLLLEWKPGASLRQAANDLRDLGLDPILLCSRVAQAYSWLHEAGVLHGDIHPGNILVDKDGAVSLVDFGLGRLLSSDPEDRLWQGGVIFYYAPEQARYLLEGGEAPLLTERAEQYSLAAVLYQVLTGCHYLDFSLQRDLALEQIVSEKPVPFSAQVAASRPELEKVLQRALSKDPAERYDSMRSFARELKKGGMLASWSPPFTEPGEIIAREAERIHRLLALDGPWWPSSLPAPTASMAFGSAGIAYSLFRIACLQKDADCLALADVWAQRAEGELGNKSACIREDYELTPEVVGSCSPYHTDSGVAAVQALIAGALGSGRRQTGALRSFLNASLEREKWDLTLGRAGVLLASSLLYDSLCGGSAMVASNREALKALGEEVLAELRQRYDSLTPLCDSRLRNLGIAHGWAGRLFAVLRWHQSMQYELPEWVVRRLEELAAEGSPAGRGLRWPWHLGDARARFMAGWCNGSAGHVLLWSLAARMSGRQDFHRLALEAGWDAWEATDLDASLCCGLVGRAYAMLSLYRLTEDEIWHRRALVLGDRASRQGTFHLDHPQSLHKGRLSLALLAADLANPLCSGFPFFEE